MVLTQGSFGNVPAWFGTDAADNETLTATQASVSTTVIAFAENDTITGSSSDDLIFGGQGDDNLSGEGGDDTVFGNKGGDRLDGGTGDDLIFGGQDDDVLIGGAGTDLLSGDKGGDTLIGDEGVDFYVGGSENDVFVLRADQAGSTIDVGSIVSGFLGVPSQIEVPDAIISDFDSNSDQIGLIGVSENDLIFENFNSVDEFGVSLDVILPLVLSSTPDAVEFLEQNGISLSDLDPDGDGALEGTTIKISSTNGSPDQTLAYVLNVDPTVLGDPAGNNFVPADGLF